MNAGFVEQSAVKRKIITKSMWLEKDNRSVMQKLTDNPIVVFSLIESIASEITTPSNRTHSMK